MKDRTAVMVMGIKHCGKSTLGRLAALKLDEPFWDLDREIELLYSESHKRMLTFREIYNTQGAEGFHHWESRAASEFCLKEENNGGVLSLGGGTVENKTAFDTLKADHRSIYLYCDEEELFSRINARPLPRFLKTEDPRASFSELYRKRDPLYRTAADVVINLTGLEIEESAERLIQAILSLRNQEV